MFSDFRFVVRQLAKAPAFTSIVLLTLALCIGANSAIFSVVRAVLLNPYPWPESNRIVYVENVYTAIGLTDAGVSVPDYIDRREGVTGFADAALFRGESFNLTGGANPERIPGLYASSSLFSTLKANAVLGRVFNQADTEPGAAKVVVISQALWNSRFAHDPAILGRTIQLNNEPYTVIGVMPEKFYFPSPHAALWVPFTLTPALRDDAQRGVEYSQMIARLKPGVSQISVQREMDLIQARNAERLPQLGKFWKSSGFGVRTVGFLDQNVEGVRDMLWLVQAGVAVALLIGCANIASLLLTRAVQRQRELAIRASLGATRIQLMRLLLTESVLLFSVGGLLGLIVAQWSIQALNTVGLSDLPRGFDVSLNFEVFAITLASSAAAGLFFGALPTWSIFSTLKSRGANQVSAHVTSGRRARALRGALVMGEIALALMLLSTAQLLVKSFARLQKESPGFSPTGTITAQIALPEAKYKQPEKILAFHDSVIATLRSTPGVTAVGMSTVLPFSKWGMTKSYTSPEIPVVGNAALPHANIRVVDPGYLSALGLKLLRGRWFADSDGPSAPRVVVIDQVLVDRYWPGQDPIGRHIDSKDGFSDSNTLCTIVGVVAPVKTHSLEENITKETIYYPLSQVPSGDLGLIARTELNPTTLAAIIRSAVHLADPEQPIYDLMTMDDLISISKQARHTPMVLLSIFSLMALLLSAIGIYGVLAFSVAQRTVEFGIRLALGAQTKNIVGLVVSNATRLVVSGIAIGLFGHIALSRIVNHLLYKVEANDISTMATVPLILGAVAAFASLVPVLRATRADPIAALRSE